MKFLRFHPCLLLAFAAPLIGQAVPTLINYQGRLTDNSPQQNPLTATVPMAFALYDAPSGGALLWREPSAGGTSVTVTGGVFSVLLGGNGVALPPSVFSGASSVRYLEITLNPGAANQEILAPRQHLAATPYADRAQAAGSADSATTALTANSATSATTATTATSAGDSAALGGLAAASWQRRIGTACAAGTAMGAVAVDGTPACVAVGSGTGTAGQNLAGVTCTGSVNITPASVFTAIPGLTSALTVPAGAKVLVSSYGGVATGSVSTTGFSSVDIALMVDGVIPANGGYERVIAANTGGVTSMNQFWSMTSVITVAAGAHTFSVRAAGTGAGSNATVCGTNTTVLQGELVVLFLKL